MRLGVIALAAAAVSSATFAASEPKQPTSKWTVEFADHDCILSRFYSFDPKDALILTFKQLPMQTGIDLYVLKHGTNVDMRSAKATVDFGAGRRLKRAPVHISSARICERSGSISMTTHTRRQQAPA
jgi:hypothetical protein